MAEPKAKEGEQDQSMEEILQSIRRIIAEEDDDAKAPGAEAAKPADTDAGDAAAKPKGSKVLELTDMVKEDGTVVSIKSEVPPPIAVEKHSAPEPELETPAVPEAPPAGAADNDVLANIDQALSNTRPVPPGEGLVSAQAAEASASAMKSMAQSIAKETAAQASRQIVSPPFRAGDTVEDLVLEALRPMLKNWLDANLPLLVERAVEKEIKRIKAMLE